MTIPAWFQIGTTLERLGLGSTDFRIRSILLPSDNPMAIVECLDDSGSDKLHWSLSSMVEAIDMGRLKVIEPPTPIPTLWDRLDRDDP